MRRLAYKTLALCVLLLGSNLVLAALVRGPLLERLDPHRALFFRPDASRYRVALLGDSVFGSHYVDRQEQALWVRLEQLSGHPTFPGALNGARGTDEVHAARLLGPRLPRGAVVFVDLPPFKVWDRDEQYYAYEMAHYGGVLQEDLSWPERAWNTLCLPVVSRMLLWRDATVLVTALRRQRWFGTGEHVNRVWDQPPEFAAARFDHYVASFRSGAATRPSDLGMVAEIYVALARSGVRPVFVLTPLNRTLVQRLAEPDLAEQLLEHFGRRRAMTVDYLRERGMTWIDLTDAIPPDGFADLGHTNAAGDELMARALAEYLATRPPAPEPR